LAGIRLAGRDCVRPVAGDRASPGWTRSERCLRWTTTDGGQQVRRGNRGRRRVERGRDAEALAQRLVAPDEELTLAHVVTTSACDPVAHTAQRGGWADAASGQDRSEELLRTSGDQAGIASRRSASQSALLVFDHKSSRLDSR